MSLKSAFFSLFCFILFSFSSVAQPSVTFKTNNPYRFRIEDAFKTSIFSSGSLSIKIQAEFSRQGLGTIIRAVSAPIELKSGVNSPDFSFGSLEEVTFFNSDYQSWYLSNQSLPSGRYQVCLKLICLNPDCDGLGAGYIPSDNSFCQYIEIENPTPLLLNTPGNESVIDDPTPLLTWIPPSPVSQDVTYTLTLTEINKEQSREEAILRNRPLIEKSGLKSISLNYPADLPELEMEHKYAWKVDAVLSGQVIATSEVWEFELSPRKQEKKPETIYYIKVREESGKSAVKTVNFLRLDYKEEVNKNAALRIVVRNARGNRVAQFDPAIQFGENLLQIDLRGIGLKSGTEYLAEITSPEGQIYLIRFEFEFSN